MTQIDELVKRARAVDEEKMNVEPWTCEQLFKALADALESQAARVKELEDALVLYRESVRIDPTMEGPRFGGANSSALRRAWEHDHALMSALRNAEGEKDGVE